MWEVVTIWYLYSFLALHIVRESIVISLWVSHLYGARLWMESYYKIIPSASLMIYTKPCSETRFTLVSHLAQSLLTLKYFVYRSTTYQVVSCPRG